jgi:hypothetical protein
VSIRLASGELIDLDVLTNYFLLGATVKDVAQFLCMDEDELEFVIQTNHLVADAVRKGSVCADANVAKALYRRACGYTGLEAKVVQTEEGVRVVEFEQHYAPDVRAAMFWLAKRRPDMWGDKQAKPEDSRESSAKAEAVRDEINRRIARLAPLGEETSLDKRPVAGSA